MDKKDFFKIECFIGGSDDRLLVGIVNQGIDAHLTAFTESKFSVKKCASLWASKESARFS